MINWLDNSIKQVKGFIESKIVMFHSTPHVCRFNKHVCYTDHNDYWNYKEATLELQLSRLSNPQTC